MNRETYFGEKIAGRKEEAISSAVREALESFCDQEPEFEQAIEQSGKTFQECLKEVVNGCGSCLSDSNADYDDDYEDDEEEDDE